ncbi:hypothetical protein [Fimbriiglobus ruber]|uniref:Uncharacterized protein n=1 Tax=Fimbriiglobus ruber TaxID=1908690 RepID=A0A225D4M7_9BACT|nr:hypothetical protein [Fimbriiglobus ruber]OWK36530.1 hypothetical protein FRUB_09093 [Fimbriiglobus ruber]
MTWRTWAAAAVFAAVGCGGGNKSAEVPANPVTELKAKPNSGPPATLFQGKK